MEGFVATAVVLVQRGGRDVPALRTPPVLGADDVSVGYGGLAATGDVQRLLVLAEEHAAAMPF
jgi:hypothetical protein